MTCQGESHSDGEAHGLALGPMSEGHACAAIDVHASKRL